MREAKTFRPLSSAAALEQALEHSEEEPVVLYKHSITCPISSWARVQMQRLTEATDPPVYELTVQAARPLSREIAEQFGIRHESPQAILLFRRRATFAASHRGVTADALRQAARDAVEGAAV